jgi:murein DD-endopeptidase MepM/ murein hydrolase activator NlpD
MSVTQTLTRFWLKNGRHALVAGGAGVLFGFLNGLIVFLQPQPLAGVLLQDIQTQHTCAFTPAYTSNSCLFASISDTRPRATLHAAADEEDHTETSSASFAPEQEQAASSAAFMRPDWQPPVSPAAQSSSSAASSSSERSEPVETPSSPAGSFPSFGKAMYPVGKIPNWGAMKTPEEWNRTYEEMPQDVYVPLPAYDMAVLTKPLTTILAERDSPQSIKELTAKLFYSTRFFGTYNPDAGEFTGKHSGIDLKLPLGTPIRSIGGGKIHAVRTTKELGLHVIVEHRVDGRAYYAIYGHFGSTNVHAGQDVQPGTILGEVGMTGNTAAPHLHLEVDTGEPDEEAHIPYMPSSVPSKAEVLQHAVNPIQFIASHR